MQRLLGDPVNELKPHEEQLMLCEQREVTVGTRTAAEAVLRVRVATFLIRLHSVSAPQKSTRKFLETKTAPFL